MMNTIERRALYNLLRMNWLNEPTIAVEFWQVEDYRALPLLTLFHRLEQFNIYLDRISFIAYADECDSPEDLTDHLIAEREFSATQEDHIYLVIFELWRRLMSEKSSLSVICNELDYQIYLYDQQKLNDPLALQDALAHFIQILDENADQGIPSQHVLSLVSTYCANDIETFLYDFISEQIDNQNDAYAHELLNDFDTYLLNNKWFKLLQLRLCEQISSKTSQKIIGEVIEEKLKDNDLDYYLELLSVLVEKGNYPPFRLVLKQTFPLIKREEDFQDLLSIICHYFHRLDQKQAEAKSRAILEKRASFPSDQNLQNDDTDLAEFTQLFNKLLD